VSAAVISSKHDEASHKARAVRAQNRQFRARRSFIAVLSGLTVFVALQLGLALVLEYGMPEVRDPLYGTRLHLVQTALRAEPTKPRTVIMLGTSRTLADLRPGATEGLWGESDEQPISVFNFGVAGGGPLSELLIWRRLQQDGVRPSLLLVEVMPILLCSQIYFHDLGAYHWPTARLRWRDLSLVKHYDGNHRPDLRRDWLTASTLPCYVERCQLISRTAPDLLPLAYRLEDEWKVDQFGVPKPQKTPTSEERRRFIEMARETYKPFVNGFRLGGPACEALRELMASCRKEGIPAALVFMPEGPAFRSWYSPDTLRDVQEWVTQLGWENAAPVIDARQWMDEDDFKDSNHLISDAAARFTDRLGREYILPLLRRLPDKEKSPHRLAVFAPQS
jgi:hypothetical protein